jgi:nucleoside-triphosphatase THEP1
MKIAYTMSPGRGDMDLVLATLANRLADAGLRACGVVQINTEVGEGRHCDMDVKVLPDGPMIRISQSLGPEARGCRLDPEGLESAVGHVASRLEQGADVLIVNKFGKQEADGRGFREVIGEALASGIPVIVGVNGLNHERLMEFCGEFAERVDAEVEALLAWVSDARKSDAELSGAVA